MIVGMIAGATRNLGAPRDWDKAKDGPCGGLPIRDEQTTAGPGMTSAWQPPHTDKMTDIKSQLHQEIKICQELSKTFLFALLTSVLFLMLLLKELYW